MLNLATLKPSLGFSESLSTTSSSWMTVAVIAVAVVVGAIYFAIPADRQPLPDNQSIATAPSPSSSGPRSSHSFEYDSLEYEVAELQNRIDDSAPCV